MRLQRTVGVLGFVCFLSVFNFATELQAKDASIIPSGHAPDVCRFNVSLHVYDDLPDEFSSDIERHFSNDTMLRSGNWDDLHTEHTFVQLFRSSPCRTNDTSLADFFVVPYMHLSDCMTTSILFGGYGPHCRQINPQKMQRFSEYLRGKETFASRGAERHLFLTMYHDFMMREEMTKFPLRIMSSPQDAFRPGQIVVPLVNLSPKFRPSELLGRGDDWWTRPRKYAFSAFYGGMNPKMNYKQPKRFRKYFFAALDKREKLQRQKGMENATLAGMPYAAGLLQKGNPNKTTDAYDAYQDSIFCPILPGDMPFARRVFDVMFHGCLPVFMRWPMDNGGKSWFVPGEFEAKYNYPFYREVFAGPPFFMSDEDTVDYESFAMEAAGNPLNERNFDSMFDAMETMIREDPGEIRRRQMRLKEQVVGLTYGLGDDAHRFNDVFSRVMKILEQLKVYGKDYIQASELSRR